jgi:hypothetical protein
MGFGTDRAEGVCFASHPDLPKCLPSAYRECDAAEVTGKFLAKSLISMVGVQGLEP